MPQPIHVRIKLTIDGARLEAAVPVPAEPSPRRVLLPILQNLTDTVVQIAEQSSLQRVSCSKGCDACCRQMVPISPTEAHALAQLISELPPEHAARILERFDRARETLDALGLLDRLENRHILTSDEQQQLDRDYFAAQIPCPFLEDHCCSIHPHRPLACREYLVTTPPENCRNPTAEQVTQLPLSAKVSRALTQTDDPPTWLPLTLARDFISTHPEPTPALLPQQLLNQILQSL